MPQPSKATFQSTIISSRLIFFLQGQFSSISEGVHIFPYIKGDFQSKIWRVQPSTHTSIWFQLTFEVSNLFRSLKKKIIKFYIYRILKCLSFILSCLNTRKWNVVSSHKLLRHRVNRDCECPALAFRPSFLASPFVLPWAMVRLFSENFNKTTKWESSILACTGHLINLVIVNYTACSTIKRIIRAGFRAHYYRVISYTLLSLNWPNLQMYRVAFNYVPTSIWGFVIFEYSAILIGQIRENHKTSN